MWMNFGPRIFQIWERIRFNSWLKRGVEWIKYLDVHEKDELLMLDPNAYSLARLHSSLRNKVVSFLVRNLELNLFVLLEAFKA